MTNNQLAIYHRAFRAYAAEIEKSNASQGFEKKSKTINKSKEYLEATRYSCLIKTDWLEAIERAVPYLDEAIRQNRQFIYQTGETVQIEKVKRVAKSSIEHLAHHSELITREPEAGDDLIPDKIYVPENMSNYAVYENRFLYLVLSITSDFIEIRYRKIIELWNTFDSLVEIDKKLTVGKRNIEYKLYVKEHAVNDRETSYDSETIERLAKMQELQQAVTMLLQTPLMREMSHTPVLKPPITRTNVIKMDPAFRAVAELYDFLVGYEDYGYLEQKVSDTVDGFSGAVARNFSELVALSSYLTYRHGGKLEDVMEREYEEEMRRQKEQEAQERKAYIQSIRQRFAQKEISGEEYIAALEQGIVALEKDQSDTRQMQQDYYECKKELEAAHDKERMLSHDLSNIKQKYAEQEVALNETQNELTRTNEKVELVSKELDDLSARYSALENHGREEQQRLNSRIHDLSDEIDTMTKTHAEELDRKNEQIDDLEQKSAFDRARLHALSEMHGIPVADADPHTKESFGELEKERLAFEKYFNARWKQTKKQIRRDVKASLRANDTKQTNGKTAGEKKHDEKK